MLNSDHYPYNLSASASSRAGGRVGPQVTSEQAKKIKKGIDIMGIYGKVELCLLNFLPVIFSELSRHRKKLRSILTLILCQKREDCYGSDLRSGAIMHPTRSTKLLFLSIKRNRVSGSGPRGPGQNKKKIKSSSAQAKKLTSQQAGCSMGIYKKEYVNKRSK